MFFDADNQSKYIQQGGFCRYCSLDLHITPVLKRTFLIGLDYPIGTDSTNFNFADADGVMTVQNDLLRKRLGYPDISVKFDLKERLMSKVSISTFATCYCNAKILDLRCIKPVSIDYALDSIISSIFEKEAVLGHIKH